MTAATFGKGLLVDARLGLIPLQEQARICLRDRVAVLGFLRSAYKLIIHAHLAPKFQIIFHVQIYLRQMGARLAHLDLIQQRSDLL